jgi:hypothetical protein
LERSLAESKNAGKSRPAPRFEVKDNGCADVGRPVVVLSFTSLRISLSIGQLSLIFLLGFASNFLRCFPTFPSFTRKRVSVEAHPYLERNLQGFFP